MHTKIFDLGSQSVKIETGLIAKQTNSSVVVDIEGTIVLATLVASTDDSERDFFPLTVNYNEKTYAAGKIPGGFFKREGSPSDKETLITTGATPSDLMLMLNGHATVVRDGNNITRIKR